MGLGLSVDAPPVHPLPLVYTPPDPGLCSLFLWWCLVVWFMILHSGKWGGRTGMSSRVSSSSATSSSGRVSAKSRAGQGRAGYVS